MNHIPQDRATRGSDTPLDEGDLRLLEAAREASIRAYAPYSGVCVGAALLDSKGRIHTGGNVENVSFGLTICAERAAVMQAVAADRREWVAIAVHATTPQAFPPCGACRQVLAEFAPQLRVLWQGADGAPQGASLGDLLAHMLTPQALSRGTGAAGTREPADESEA